MSRTEGVSLPRLPRPHTRVTSPGAIRPHQAATARQLLLRQGGKAHRRALSEPSYTAYLGTPRQDVPHEVFRDAAMYDEVFDKKGALLLSRNTPKVISPLNSLQYNSLHDPHCQKLFLNNKKLRSHLVNMGLITCDLKVVASTSEQRQKIRAHELLERREQLVQGISGRELGDFVGRGVTLKDCDLNTGDDKLCCASLKGDLREVKRLTEEEQYDPLGVDENGINALHYAAAAGHLDMLRYFTEDRGCNAACTGLNGLTALHFAARFKQFDIVRYLLEKQQVEPFSRTNDGSTALHHACSGGSVDVIHYLAKEMSKYLPLKEVVEDQTHEGIRPLHLAAAECHLEAVKFILTELNSDPNATINDGANALHLAVFGGNLEVVKYLIELHRQHCDAACRSTKVPEGWHGMARLLELARYGGHHHIVEYLWSLNDL